MSLIKTPQFPSIQKFISSTASLAATAMFLRSLAIRYLPRDLKYYLYSKLPKLFATFSSQITLVIREFESLNYNHLFEAAELYLRPHISPNAQRCRVTMPKKENKISVVMERNEEIIDNFNGIRFKWKLVSEQVPPKYIQSPGPDGYYSAYQSELRYFTLCFNKKHKDVVFAEYLPYVKEKAKEVREEQKTLKLFTLARHGIMWQSVALDHPATFDTLAMDLEVKEAIMEDLDRFMERKDLYRKVGKAWKRGYLLHGPPGTGKSSLVAAMANYLKFDIYDLELTDLRRNSDLRELLISTGDRSILVVEDIDCSLELQDRHAKAAKRKAPIPIPIPTPIPYPSENQRPKVTLSGFLNFIDGLWSSCGDKRIIVFTTNHKERLDPALLRPGRMDVHIHMSYCTPSAFKLLASNYLGITEHRLFDQVEKLLKTTNVTLAEVGEQLLKNEDSEIALRSPVELLMVKKEGREGSEVRQADLNLSTTI